MNYISVLGARSIMLGELGRRGLEVRCLRLTVEPAIQTLSLLRQKGGHLASPLLSTLCIPGLKGLMIAFYKVYLSEVLPHSHIPCEQRSCYMQIWKWNDCSFYIPQGTEKASSLLPSW